MKNKVLGVAVISCIVFVAGCRATSSNNYEIAHNVLESDFPSAVIIDETIGDQYSVFSTKTKNANIMIVVIDNENKKTFTNFIVYRDKEF